MSSNEKIVLVGFVVFCLINLMTLMSRFYFYRGKNKVLTELGWFLVLSGNIFSLGAICMFGRFRSVDDAFGLAFLVMMFILRLSFEFSSITRIMRDMKETEKDKDSDVDLK